MKEKFYQEPTGASRAKQKIVATYFGAWKNVIKTWRNSPSIAYVDLYSGPGIYADGSYSTPLLVLNQGIEDEYLRRKLITVFNDGDSDLAAELRKNIAALPGIERLENQPKTYEYSVSEMVMRLAPRVPTLLFADPWGYKGLSLPLIRGFLDTPGTDCILFFNYRRINAGLGYSGFDEPIDAVFGSERAQSLRKKIQELGPTEREKLIVTEMQDALKGIGAHCVLPFRFVSSDADRPSHHLLFASKHPLGCKIMKPIMRNRSSNIIQGIGSFEFSGVPVVGEQIFFPGFGPLDDLRIDVLRKFAGKTLRFEKLVAEHDHPTATDANYKAAILQLESEGAVTVEVPGRQRRKFRGALTVPDDAVITFLKQGG